MIVFCCICTQFVTLCIIIAFSLTEIGRFLVADHQQRFGMIANGHPKPLDVHLEVQDGRS